MAHALLATVNPVLGIYTLMIAVPIGAIFTGSVFMNVSTTSALSVAAGAGLADVPASQRMEALGIMVLLVGVIQLLAGLFRLGFVLRFVSNAVMTGFLNGVAVLIILGQLGDLTGFSSPYRNNVVRALHLLLNPAQVVLPTTIIGVLTLALIVVLLATRLRRFAFIIAIAAATILLAILTLPQLPTAAMFGEVQTVGDITTIPRSLPRLALPSPSLVLPMLLPAFSVAIIGLIQGAGVSQGTPNPNGKFPNVSRDFFGQGAANLATSFVGGLPAGGSISGTVLIMGVGAKSRWTNIFAGLFVALVVLLFAPLVKRVPMPALAALLIVAGFQGLRIPQAVAAWKTGRITAAVMVLTFVATLFISLQFAVLLGVALSIVLHVVRVLQQGEGHRMDAPAERLPDRARGAQAGAEQPIHALECLRQPVFCRRKQRRRNASEGGRIRPGGGGDHRAGRARGRQHLHERHSALRRIVESPQRAIDACRCGPGGPRSAS